MEKVTAIVVFRVFKKEGDVIALFPGIPNGWPMCSSYQRDGQHGPADYAGLVSATNPPTRPAKPEEYKALKAELESIGYILKVRQKYVRPYNALPMSTGR